MNFDEETLKLVKDALAKGRTIGDYVVKGVDFVWNETKNGIQTYVVFKDDNDSIFRIENFDDLKAFN